MRNAEAGIRQVKSIRATGMEGVFGCRLLIQQSLIEDMSLQRKNKFQFKAFKTPRLCCTLKTQWFCYVMLVWAKAQYLVLRWL